MEDDASEVARLMLMESLDERIVPRGKRVLRKGRFKLETRFTLLRIIITETT